MSEFSPLWGGNEGEGELLRRSKRSCPGAYGACDDEEEQEKEPALLWRRFSHNCPRCGQLRDFERALFCTWNRSDDAFLCKIRLSP